MMIKLPNPWSSSEFGDFFEKNLGLIDPQKKKHQTSRCFVSLMDMWSIMIFQSLLRKFWGQGGDDMKTTFRQSPEYV